MWVAHKVDAGQWFLSFFKDFIGTPAILIGLFAMLGAILLRKKANEIIMSFFKTAAGFLIIGGGATVLVAALSNFQVLFQDLFKIKGLIPNNDAFAGALFKEAPAIAQLGSIIMILAMVLNVALAFSSRFKYIYLSGHVLFYMSIMLAGVMTIGANFDLSNPADYTIALISSGLIMAIYMVFSCAVTKKYVQRITNQDSISMAHTGNFGYFLSGLIGDGIGKLKKGKIKSTEDINFPKWLLFFRNTFVSMAITMLIVFLVVYVPEGIMYNLGIKELEQNADKSFVNQTLAALFGPSFKTNWLVVGILDAFTFAAGVEILLYGVRMAIGELIPCFKGISDKLVKDSKAGLDCPIVFPYAPNAVLIGFLSSLVAGIIGIGITVGLNLANILIPVIIPGIVAHFFLGATSGVFGNIKGGIWGAIVGSFVHGIIITLVPVIFAVANWVPLGQDGNPLSLGWGDTDYLLGVFPGIIALIPNRIAVKVLLILVPAIVFIALSIDGQIKRINDKKNNSTTLNSQPIKISQKTQ